MKKPITCTPGQTIKMLQTLEQQEVTDELLQQHGLQNGLFSDFAEAIAKGTPINRKKWRKALGLDPSMLIRYADTIVTPEDELPIDLKRVFSEDYIRFFTCSGFGGLLPKDRLMRSLGPISATVYQADRYERSIEEVSITEILEDLPDRYAFDAEEGLVLVKRLIEDEPGTYCTGNLRKRLPMNDYNEFFLKTNKGIFHVHVRWSAGLKKWCISGRKLNVKDRVFISLRPRFFLPSEA